MLPLDTSLGQLQIFEIYEFYNMPVLFACKNQADSIYLAVWIDETTDAFVWLYVPVSPRRFAKIRAGQIDLHDAFTKPEDGIALKVTVPNSPLQTAQVESIRAAEIDIDWAPLANEYLDVPDSLPRIRWDGVNQLNPTTAAYPKHVTPDPWYRQLEIPALSLPL